MTVAVLGLWHLGSVVAACLAQAGHAVIGWDPDEATVAGLLAGRPPIAEPGLADLLSTGLSSGRLRFTPSAETAVCDADVVWIAFDTPVDEDDRADVESVFTHVRLVLPWVREGAVVVSSSQLPVGSVDRIAREIETMRPGASIDCVSAPENLRLGSAIERFVRPDRVVLGVSSERARNVMAALFAPITDRIVWMSIESAEMTKHAINAFLATSVTFINELASICEVVGADAKEVERGLKSDQRIGPGAYLSPGAAFAGGTLARDVVLLEQIAQRSGIVSPVVTGVRESNRAHASWPLRTLRAHFASLSGRRIAVWGLTYKSGTDTLRRSTSVELCRAIATDGAIVTAFDPAIHDLPADLESVLTLASTPLAAATGADAVVVATEWPIFREQTVDALVDVMSAPLVVDAGRFLAKTMGAEPRIRYVAVGVPRA